MHALFLRITSYKQNMCMHAHFFEMCPSYPVLLPKVSLTMLLGCIFKGQVPMPVPNRNVNVLVAKHYNLQIITNSVTLVTEQKCYV